MTPLLLQPVARGVLGICLVLDSMKKSSELMSKTKDPLSPPRLRPEHHPQAPPDTGCSPFLFVWQFLSVAIRQSREAGPAEDNSNKALKTSPQPHPLGNATAYPGTLLGQQTHQLHMASSCGIAEGGHAILRRSLQAGTKFQEQSDHLLMAEVGLDAQDWGVI